MSCKKTENYEFMILTNDTKANTYSEKYHTGKDILSLLANSSFS